VAVTPSGAFAYVTNSGWIFGSDYVSVIDTASNSVVAAGPVGHFPVGIAIRPDGAFACVANLNSNSVSVISTATNTVAATVELVTGAWLSRRMGLCLCDERDLQHRLGNRHRHQQRQRGGHDEGGNAVTGGYCHHAIKERAHLQLQIGKLAV
jgi:YVTN family beta-propeller protein